MTKSRSILYRSLPILVVAALALFVALQIAQWDDDIRHAQNVSFVDSGIGWFPLIWLVLAATPMMVASLLCAKFGEPTRRYWSLVLGLFIALSGIGLYLDNRAYHLTCQGCIYIVPGL